MTYSAYHPFFIAVTLFSLIFSSTANAGIFPDTTIESDSFQFYTADNRLNIKAQLNDSEGVTEARCYFKTDTSGQLLYTSMSLQQEGDYLCNLPAFNKNTHRLEYFFLIINDRRQVIRSPIFSAAASNDKTTLQTMPSSSEELAVYSELPDINLKKSGISDNLVTIKFTKLKYLYGLRVGLYSSNALPASLNIMHGYFGGFLMNEDSSLDPVRGMVPNLQKKTEIPEADSNESVFKTTPNATPNIAGNDWRGYFQYGWSSDKTQVTATITLSGSVVTITTSKTGIAHYLAGTMNSTGDMLIYDRYDGEDWTTHFGPATSTSINLYDYAWPPQPGQPEPPLNKIILSRHAPVPPTIPTGIEASDGAFLKEILVSWDQQVRTNYFQVFSCQDNTTTSCSLQTSTTANQYTDTTQGSGVIYYRIKACNDYGCSAFSEYDTGYKRQVSLPFLHLLLGVD